MRDALLTAGAALYGAAWETRRRAYAAGLCSPRRVGCRVASIGNLTAGGTGKTTLTLHLARRALARGIDVRVVARRYRPGPAGRGDEELLYRAALGEARVRAGRNKRDLAGAAAVEGADLVLVDDGFSHWGLARDVDVVLVDAGDPWGGGRLLPAGRLREPMRALQRADVVVVSRLPVDADPAAALARVRAHAPGARLAAGRHAIASVAAPGAPDRPPAARARVVTATGHPAAVAASAREAGYGDVALAAYRDHHWFTAREMAAELARARADGADLVLTAKDAVRWTLAGPEVRVLEVVWAWACGGDAVESLVFEGAVA